MRTITLNFDWYKFFVFLIAFTILTACSEKSEKDFAEINSVRIAPPGMVYFSNYFWNVYCDDFGLSYERCPSLEDNLLDGKDSLILKTSFLDNSFWGSGIQSNEFFESGVFHFDFSCDDSSNQNSIFSILLFGKSNENKIEFGIDISSGHNTNKITAFIKNAGNIVVEKILTELRITNSRVMIKFDSQKISFVVEDSTLLSEKFSFETIFADYSLKAPDSVRVSISICPNEYKLAEESKIILRSFEVK